MSSSVPPRDDHGRFIKANAMVTVPREELQGLERAVNELEQSNIMLTERMQSLDMMIDEKGWSAVYEHAKDGGMTLDQLHASSEQLRELVAGNPFMKRGSQLRITYVWGGGLEFATRKLDGKPETFSQSIKTIMRLPKNRRSLFSAPAREMLERAAFTDGMVFALGDNSKKTYQIVPLREIKGMLHNPDDSSEVWAYRRVWFKNPSDAKPAVMWYYTDTFEGEKKKRIWNSELKEIENVDIGKTMIDGKFNSHGGWALGVPDGLAAIGWVRLYREFLVNGSIMSRALAQFAYRATMKSQEGKKGAAIEVQRPANQSGSTVISSEDFQPLSSAGKGYDFGSGRPLAAGIAAALEVSLVGLLSDPGAGGTVGTAQTLDPPAKATASLRRLNWDEWNERIFRHMGLVKTQELVSIWHDLREEPMQRMLQAIAVVHQSGLFDGGVVQKLMAEVMSIAEPGSIPDGYLLPNNEKSLARRDIDPEGTGQPGTSPTAGSGQGQSSPGGAGNMGNDHDDDED